MATCSSCGKVCIIVQERSFTTAADSCDVQLTLDDSQTPGVLSASLVVDDDPTNLLVPGTCGWSVPEAAVISVIDANICTILSDQSISCFGDVDTTTTPPTSGQFMAWNGTQWVPATLPAGTAVNIEDANGNVTVLNGNGNIPTDCTLEVNGGILSLATISAQASLSVGNTPVAPTPASGAVIVPTQTISITNPSACRSMAYLFVCPGVDMSIVGASTNGAFLGIQSQININGGAFFQTSDTTLSTNGVSGVGYIGHDSNTNGHVLTGTIAPGASVSIGLRVQFIKGSAAGAYSSLVVQGSHMSIIGSLI